MSFSVLMSIYCKEKPQFFHQAMQSIWDSQTLRPSEIVLVEDGSLTEELYEAIGFWKKKLNCILKIVVLPQNKGLGAALNVGLVRCQYEYVARMDTDDVCMPDRFEKQVTLLQKKPNIDVLGGQIEEFENEVGDLKIFRTLPCEYNSLKTFAKKRCPFNHPTVIYRKSAVLAAGGYQDDYLYEDYVLWIHMIRNGAVIANLPDTILYMRSGNSMFKRRGGVKYAINEARVQYKFYQLGLLNIFDLLTNLSIRLPVRLLPNHLRGFIYQNLLRKKQ